MNLIITFAICAVIVTTFIEYQREIEDDQIIKKLEQKLIELRKNRNKVMEDTAVILQSVKQVQEEFHIHRKEMREDNKILNDAMNSFVENVGKKFDAQDRRMDILEKSNALLMKNTEIQGKQLEKLETNVDILTRIEERRNAVEEEKKRRKAEILKKIGVWSAGLVGFLSLCWGVFTFFKK